MGKPSTLDVIIYLQELASNKTLKWESLPEYLEHNKDPELENYIMLHNPYIINHWGTLDEYNSWRVTKDEVTFYLFRSPCGYEIRIRSENNDDSFCMSTESELKEMLELIKLVQARVEEDAALNDADADEKCQADKQQADVVVQQ